MSKPFVLLVNPWIYDFAAYDLWVKPVGLLRVASVLQKSGFGVHLIDCLDPDHPCMQETADRPAPARSPNGKGHFRKQRIPKPPVLRDIPRKYSRYGIPPAALDRALALLPRPAAVIVTSMMTYWYPGVIDVMTHVQRHFPGITILLGGVYATLCPAHARKNTPAAMVIPGPCDQRLLRVLERVTAAKITHRCVSGFPRPDCGLMTSKKSIPLLTSHGCPFSCSYCASKRLQPHFVQIDPVQVVEEIQYWIEHENTTDFVFYDDALLVNPEQHIIPLLRAVINRGLHARFHAPNGLHIKNIQPSLAALMRRAGFATVRLGLESSNPVLQQSTGNKVSNREFVQAADALRRAGFSDQEVGVYILAGLPEQDHAGVYQSVCFVQDQGLRPLIAEYSPIPGTSLWERAVTCSALPIALEPLFHNNSLLPCQWERFTLQDLQRLKRLSRP